MSFTYNPLWKLLIDKNISYEELRSALGFSFSTMTKMKKGQYVSLEVLHRLCVHLDCQPGDLIAYLRDEVKTAPTTSPFSMDENDELIDF